MGLALLDSLTEGPFFPQASWNNKGSDVTFKNAIALLSVDSVSYAY